MRAKHRRTLQRLFSQLTPANIRWSDVVSPLRALDVEVGQRAGSRVLLKRSGRRIVVHQPHPGPETGRETVRDIASFLKDLGETP